MKLTTIYHPLQHKSKFKRFYTGKLVLLLFLFSFCFNIQLNHCSTVELYKSSNHHNNTVVGETGVLLTSQEQKSFNNELAKQEKSSSSGHNSQKFSGTRKKNELVAISKIDDPKQGSRLSKSVGKFLKKISNDVTIQMVKSLVSKFSGAVSKRSHDSTFALIAFVTFGTFVLFTLLPLLTLPRRQRIAKQYANKFHRKGNLFKKPLFKPNFTYKPAPIKFKYKKHPYGYGAVAVPIKSSSTQDDHHHQQQQQQQGNVDYDDDTGDASNVSSFDARSKDNNYNFDNNNNVNEWFQNNPTDNEYLTKEEIMYLLKTL